MAAQSPAVKAKVWLFHLKHSRKALCINIIREVCSYLADLQLAQVTATFLRFFNCETWVWGPKVQLFTPIQVDTGSIWAVLEDGRLFCSGGAEGFFAISSVAYLLSRDGAVDQLPNLLAARKDHGVIQVLHIYTFGGCKL